jgi:hypothetical protein
LSPSLSWSSTLTSMSSNAAKNPSQSPVITSPSPQSTNSWRLSRRQRGAQRGDVAVKFGCGPASKIGSPTVSRVFGSKFQTSRPRSIKTTPPSRSCRGTQPDFHLGGVRKPKHGYRLDEAGGSVCGPWSRADGASACHAKRPRVAQERAPRVTTVRSDRRGAQPPLGSPGTHVRDHPRPS